MCHQDRKEIPRAPGTNCRGPPSNIKLTFESEPHPLQCIQQKDYVKILHYYYY